MSTKKWNYEIGQVEARHPRWRRDELEHRVKAWTRKLAAVKLPAPEVKIEDDPNPIIREVWDDYYQTFHKETVEALKFSYSGIIGINLGDDKLVGSVDLTHSEPVWAMAPNQEMTPSQRKTVTKNAGACSICKSKRERKSTLLFRSPAGRITQIGRNCAAKVFGLSVDLSFLECILASGGWDDEGSFGGWRQSIVREFSDVVVVAAGIIDHCGWVSRKKADETMSTPTSALVTQWLYGRLKPEDQLDLMKGGQPSEAHIKLGADVWEWCKALPKAGNDYEHKLRVLANDNWISAKDVGVAASAVVAYRRAMNLIKERESTPESNWIAEPGTAIGLKKKGSLPAPEVEIKGVYPSEFSTVVKMVTTDGNVIVAFMGHCSANTGDKVRVAGTIKNNNVRAGVKQTILTRAKFLDL